MTDVVERSSVSIADTVRDFAMLASAIRKTEHAERTAVTTRLLLIAFAVDVHGHDAVFQLLTQTLLYGDAYSIDLMRLATSIGADRLQDALARHPLTLAQWQAIAEVGNEMRAAVIDATIEHDLPPLQIAAHATGRDTAELHVEQLLKRLDSLLKRLEDLGAHNQAIDILAKYGYVTKIVGRTR